MEKRFPVTSSIANNELAVNAVTRPVASLSLGVTVFSAVVHDSL